MVSLLFDFRKRASERVDAHLHFWYQMIRLVFVFTTQNLMIQHINQAAQKTRVFNKAHSNKLNDRNVSNSSLTGFDMLLSWPGLPCKRDSESQLESSYKNTSKK